MVSLVAVAGAVALPVWEPAGDLLDSVIAPHGVPGRLLARPFPAQQCGSTTSVEVVVTPLVEQAAGAAVEAAPKDRLPDGSCLAVEVRAQEPADTIAGSTVLPAGRAPDLWISDSSIWLDELKDWDLTVSGSFGNTPVVLATNSTNAQARGWLARPPGWGQMMTGSQPLAAPQLTVNASGLLALESLWQVTGAGPASDRAVGASLLAVQRDRSPTEEEALRAARRPGPGSPLVLTSEQAVLAANADSVLPDLVALQPAEGSPVLDFPVVRIEPTRWDHAHRHAVDVVVAALTGAPGRAAARTLGLRDPTGASSTGLQLLAAPPAAQRRAFLERLLLLAKPSRVLLVVDVSPSMRTRVPRSGLSRVQLAGRAALAAGQVLPDDTSVGLWIFSRDLVGDLPFRELVPVRPLGSYVDGTSEITQRQLLVKELGSLDRRISGGGTSLYRTAHAAVLAMRASYDPRTVNQVVLLTDGRDEGGDGPDLERTAAALRAETTQSSARPVQLVGIGLGNSADLPALGALAAATGGLAFRAETPTQLQQVLFTGLSTRTSADGGGASQPS